MWLQKLRRVRQQHEFEWLYARLSLLQREELQADVVWLHQPHPRRWWIIGLEF